MRVTIERTIVQRGIVTLRDSDERKSERIEERGREGDLSNKSPSMASFKIRFWIFREYMYIYMYVFVCICVCGGWGVVLIFRKYYFIYN